MKGWNLNPSDVDFFRRLLNQRISELRFEAGKTVENMDEDGNFPDPTDRASLEASRNSVLRIRDRERRRTHEQCSCVLKSASQATPHN